MLFQGRPSTIKSEHFIRSGRLIFAVGFSKPSSPFRLFSAADTENRSTFKNRSMHNNNKIAGQRKKRRQPLNKTVLKIRI